MSFFQFRLIKVNVSLVYTAWVPIWLPLFKFFKFFKINIFFNENFNKTENNIISPETT